MHAIIFLNGQHTNVKVIARCFMKDSCIVAADGASNYLRKMGIIPDVIIGDLDSIEKKTEIYFRKKNISIIKVEEQETTDFEKALNFCLERGLTDITVLSAMSMRPDHTINNFSVLKKFYKKADIRIISDEYEIFFIRKKISFSYRKNEIVSLMAMPLAKGITTTGLKYKLKNQDLEFGIKEGTLNNSITGRVNVTFKSGDLLLFKKHFI